MNYSGNVPDWHQYNVSQTNEVVQSTQNVNSGHLTYIPGGNSPAFNALTVNSDGFNKHPNDSNFNVRNFQSFNNASNGPNISTNSPLASMMQMQNCINHYGSSNTRNPMLDNLNAPADHRNTAVGSINDEIGYRSNQVPFNGPIGHLNGPNCNLSAPPVPGFGPGPGSGTGTRANSGPGPETSPGTVNGPGPSFGSGSRHGPVPGSGTRPGNIGPRNTNIGSIHPGKAGHPSFMPCKGPCCTSDTNINYQQWEKFGSYQNNTSYRDNVHVSSYQMENRHFGNNCNFRKDNLENKESMVPVLPNASSVDHRRNFVDYKYHKDHMMHRNYSTPSGMFHGYPMQNYNYSAEHQKYPPYPMKEHSKTNNMNMSSSGVLKHQEQHMIGQQKFNNKQFQYQNSNMLPKGIPSLNVNGSMPSSSQNAYFNSQFARNVPTEVSHECQESTDGAGVTNRMQPGTFVHNSASQHQTYQHKIAMQKFSIENHLRELSRIPGYQSHPKYKECVLRYRELQKLHQSTGYQSSVQQSSCIATPVNTAAVPPINLQFDQNGILINSNYLSDDFSKLQDVQSTEPLSENIEKQVKDQTMTIVNKKCQEKQQSEQSKIPLQSERASSSSVESSQKQNQFSMHKDLDKNQLKVQNHENHSFDTLNIDANSKTMMQQKASKEFANKPGLDVRQFLANWDETDDEEGTTSNIPETLLNESTPVVVLSYENVDLASKTGPNTELFKKSSLCLNDAALDNEKESGANVIAAQDCLTISYPSSENTDITETSKQTIGEGVMKPGSIIHCISNGPDEIPTIHIVDNLEITNILGASNDQVAETLGKHKAISFFKEVTNNETKTTMVLGNTDQRNENDTRTVSPNYDASSLGNANKDADIEDANITETIETGAVASINNQQSRTLSSTGKNNIDIADNLDFKKQNNFVNEESHNPDDISLPDLPTSECTPISTTLNTPIHSDSEESSQNIDDLSMSANPIEVMQNSPVISFTQSPVKIEPYGLLSTEEKNQSRSLDTLELDLQKENRYKDDVESTYEQDVNLDNFNFCTSDTAAKSAETAKDQQIKRFEANLVRKKDTESRISDTYAALTSIEYELGIQEKTTENEKNSECKSGNSRHEGKPKDARKPTDSVESVVENSEPVANKSINPANPSLSEVDLNAKEIVKGPIVLEHKYAEKGSDKAIKMYKKNVDHSKVPERLDAKKCCGDRSNASQGEAYSVCRATSQSKSYTTAVIKDNIILNEKKSHSTTEKNTTVFCEKLAENQLRTDTIDGFSGEAGNKKHVSNKSISISYGSIQSPTSKKYELLQKDSEIASDDVACAIEEPGLLKEYKKTNKPCEAHNTRDKYYLSSKEHSIKTASEESSSVNNSNDAVAAPKMSLEQSTSTRVNINPDYLKTSDETKKHTYTKSFVKNATSDFGIQVANVNLKIKESEVGKELILDNKGPERVKDGIKIEINVSCTERNSKGQEHNKQLLKLPLYEAEDSPAYSLNTCYNNIVDSQQRHDKQQKPDDNSEICKKVYKIIDESPGTMEANDKATSAVDTNVNTIRRKRKSSSEANERAFASINFKEAYNLTPNSQILNKLLHNNVLCKDMEKAEVIENINYNFNNDDMVKSNCAISHTAITNASDKVLIRGKSKFDEETGTVNMEEGDETTKTQKHSLNLVAETIAGASKQNDEKGVIVSQMSKNIVKLPEIHFMESSAKSSKTLNTLDINLDNIDYEKYSSMNFDRVYPRVNRIDDFDGCVEKWKKPKTNNIFEDCDMFQSTSGYMNPTFSNINKLEDLHTVPVYTTKDGKISYSPNRKFTYHELMMEARKREGFSSARKQYYTDVWSNYCSSRFRKIYRKRRHHDFSNKKKHEFKDMKYLYERKRSCLDEFCTRNHVKYKDCAHSIQNDNAVWSDCKINKVYSSSESDEEIVDRIKHRTIETSSYKTGYIIGNKIATIIPEPRKAETVTDDLNVRSKESNASDVIARKETQLIELPFVDSKFNKNCQNDNQKNAESNKTEITTEFSTKSCNLISENTQLNESRDAHVETINTNLVKSKNQSSSVHSEKETNIRDELSDSKLFKEVIASSNNEEKFGSQTPEARETDITKQTSFVKTDHNSENICDAQVFESMENKQIEELKSGIDQDNCSPAKELSELNVEIVETTESKSQASPLRKASIEAVQMSGKRTEKCVLECEQEEISTIKNTQVSIEEQTHRESAKQDIEKNIKPKSPSLINVAFAKEEECESHAKNNENTSVNCRDVNSVEGKECEVSSTNLSKDRIRSETENNIKELVVSNKNGTESTETDRKEISRNCSPLSSIEHDVIFNRNSSVDKGMPVLNKYCAVKNSPTNSIEDTKTKTEETKQKEEEYRLTSLEFYKSINHLSEKETNLKTIPKLVLKKTDNLISKSGCPSSNTESENSVNTYDAKLLNDTRLKIPKMIIMKSRSRSVTPTTDILEKAKSERISHSKHTDTGTNVENSDSEQHTSKCNNYANRVPRVTIKLEDISSKDLKLYLKRKAAQKSCSKLASKKCKTKEDGSSSTKLETEDTSETETTDSDGDDDRVERESLASNTEKMPKLKLKRQEDEETSRAKDSKVLLKKIKKTREEDTREFIKCNDTAINDEIRKKYPQCITEKIPKVIIKRTHVGTEFKCEISKSKKNLNLESSKWQPKVKLQRMQVLDFMVKDLKQSTAMAKDKPAVNSIVNVPLCIKNDIRNVRNKDSSSVNKATLCRSSSATNLFPIHCKQRRLSDYDYIKTDAKLAVDFIDDSEDKHEPLGKSKLCNVKAIDSENENENKSLKRNSKRRSFSQIKATKCNLNDESQDEINEAIDSEDITESSFLNRFVNETNDPSVTRKEYSQNTKESMSCIGEKFLMSSIVCSSNFDDNGNSIIKVDSSDESQTTIELLPASPDSSEDESKRNSLRAEHAMPTQLELELELIDNNNAQRSCAITPQRNEDTRLSSWVSFNRSNRVTVQNEQTRRVENKSSDYFYCNDSLVKEVLAAKETLKKCLTKSTNEETEGRKSRPKTLAEKKQGLSFSFSNIKESYCENDNRNTKICKNPRTKDKEVYKCLDKRNLKESEESRHSSLEKRIELKDSEDGNEPCSTECSTASTCGYTNVPELTTISLKATKKLGRFVNNATPSNLGTDSSNISSKHNVVGDAEKSYEEKSEERTATGTREQKNETKSKEDNMPLLVPEFALNLDSHSDRDSSRSPPVITNQEELDNLAEEGKNEKSKVISIEKAEEEKQHSYKDYEMTIGDIITQLAYHEKATIRHKRYCNLCERWFPTTSRHRRHLTGYQHRYMELSQRKSIHALFVLFTGKPCPRLLPANVVRNDCSIGELTPLQIAVQDVANYIEHTQRDLKTKE